VLVGGLQTNPLMNERLITCVHVSDEATQQLRKQEDTQFESHEKIVADLTQIQQKSHDALHKLGKVVSVRILT